MKQNRLTITTLLGVVLLVLSASIVSACRTSVGYNSISYECIPTKTDVSGNIDVTVTVKLMEESDVAKLEHAIWALNPVGDGGVLFVGEESVDWDEKEGVEEPFNYKLEASISATATNEGTVIIEIDQNLPDGVSPILFEGDDPCEITIGPAENGHEGNGEGNGNGDDGEGNGHEGGVDTETTATCFTRVWQIGSYNDKLEAPWDELQPDETVNQIDFTIGRDPLSDFPGLTKFDDNIATVVNINFSASMPLGGRLLISWSPGAVGDEVMNITLDGQEVGVLERTGATNEEWWQSYERFIDSFDIGVLEDDDHTLVIECTSGDGAIWDWLRLEEKVSCQVGTISTGDRNLYMALSNDKAELYVVDIGSAEDNQGKIWVINTGNNEHQATIAGLGDGFPYQIAVIPNSDKAYLAITKAAGPTITKGTNRIVVIDTASYEVKPDVITIGGDNDYGPVTVVISPDGQHAYTTHRGLHRIDAINTISDEVIDSEPNIGSIPLGMAITSENRHLWVTNVGDGTIAVIDITSEDMRLVEKAISLNLEPSGGQTFIAVTPVGDRAYVTNQGDSRIAVIDIDPANEETYLQVEYIPTTATVLSQIAISPDGERALVANNTPDILVLDIKPTSDNYNEQIGSVPVGRGTFGIVFMTSNIAYASGGDNVWVITEIP